MRFLTIGKREFKKELLDKKNLEIMFKKPRGCFWGSLYEPERKYKSDWCRWVCDNMSSGYYTYGITYSLKEDSKVYIINEKKDLEELLIKYNAKNDSESSFIRHILEMDRSSDLFTDIVDWIKVAEDYDAVYLTEKGADKLYFDLYGWDCGSIAIFNPDIVEDIEYVEWEDEV